MMFASLFLGTSKYFYEERVPWHAGDPLLLVLPPFSFHELLFGAEVSETCLDRPRSLASQSDLPEGQFLLMSQVEGVFEAHHDGSDQERSPQGCNHGDHPSRRCGRTDVTVSHGRQSDDDAPDGVEVRVQLVRGVGLQVEKGKFENSEHVSQRENGQTENHENGSGWVSLHVAFQRKASVGGKAQLLSDVFGIRVCVLAVVEQTPHQEEASQPHYCDDEFAPQVHDLCLPDAAKAHVKIDEWPRAER